MDRAPGYWAGTVANTDQQGFMDRIASEHELNESRRAALAAALDHHLTRIQGRLARARPCLQSPCCASCRRYKCCSSATALSV